MKILLVTLSLLLSLGLHASGGDEVRNGGGLVEQNFTYALKILPEAINRCLVSKNCAQTGLQKNLLRKIKAANQTEIDAGVLKFIRVPSNPDFFMIDGLVRMAITGNYVGSPIYYNLKLLYENGDSKISLGQAVQSLIHELGHHHGVVDHDALEILGSEVRGLTESTLIELPYFVQRNSSPFQYKAITAVSIGRDTIGQPESGTISLIFQNDTIDITHHFESLLSKCDLIPRAPLISSSMTFFNLHWDYKPNELASNEKFLSGNVNLFCKTKYGRVHKKNFKFDLKILISKNGLYSYRSSELLRDPELLVTQQIRLLRDR